jgi:hypothetical protein
MAKCRQMYNEIFFGTSNVSILKFYYASFKIQQSKGKVSDVGTFLYECARISDDTNLLLKLFDFLPLLNLCFGTGREQKRIAEIIRTKRENVENLFLKVHVFGCELFVFIWIQGFDRTSEASKQTNGQFQAFCLPDFKG